MSKKTVKELGRLKTLLSIVALLPFFMAGCASSNKNVDPPQATQNTGYIDFYADPPARLSWSVERLDGGTPILQKSFFQLPSVGR